MSALSQQLVLNLHLFCIFIRFPRVVFDIGIPHKRLQHTLKEASKVVKAKCSFAINSGPVVKAKCSFAINSGLFTTFSVWIMCLNQLQI